MNSVFWTKSSWCEIVFICSKTSYNTGTVWLYLKDVLALTAVSSVPLQVQALLGVRDMVLGPFGVSEGVVVVMASCL